MKSFALGLALIFALSVSAFAASPQQGFSDPSATSLPATAQKPVTAGGFSGPGPAVVTVQQAKEMKDDSPVTLRGNIIQALGDENYMFRDSTGTIRVDIDNKKWRGVSVTPADTVEIQGEIDKDWNSIEIDVDSIQKL